MNIALGSLVVLLPDILKTLSVNIYGMTLQRKRYPAEFRKVLQYYSDNDRLEAPEPDLEKISSLIKGSHFYKVMNVRGFCEAPVINKEIVSRNYEAILNKKYAAAFLSTTGTTGAPLKVPVSREFIYHQWAVFWKFRIMHGLNMDTWCAYFQGKHLFPRDKKSPPFWLQSWATKQLLMSIIHLNLDTVESYLCEIKKRGIRWMHAYPSVLMLLTELIAEKNLYDFVRTLNLSVITTSSEIITCAQKVTIENIFGCRVRQLYGLTEGVANIFECEKGRLHIDESFSLVELQPEINNEEYCKIIGSHYHNRAFPLIRYDTGDICRVNNQLSKCQCGRHSRVIDEIIGRGQDFLFLSDHSKIVSPDLIFKNIKNIRKVQIIQNKPGHAEFYITKSREFSSRDDADIRRSISDYLGSKFSFSLIYTPVMPLEKNGKWPFVVRDL